MRIVAAATLLACGVQSAHASTPTQAELAVAVVKPISDRAIFPETRLAFKEGEAVLEVSAVRDEYEPGSFVVVARDRDIVGIRVTASDLLNDKSKVAIPAQNLDIRIVKTWFQGASAWTDIGRAAPSDFRQQLVPELLLKDDNLVVVDTKEEKNYVKLIRKSGPYFEWINPKRLAGQAQVSESISDFPLQDSVTLLPFDLPAESAKQIWITFYVPETADPGTYMGQITLSSKTGDEGSITVRLNVYPFALQAPRSLYSMYYRGQLDSSRASIGSEFKSALQMERELADLRRHGVANPTLYQSMVDRNALASALRARELAGLNAGPLLYLGIQTTEDFFAGSDVEKMRGLRQTVPVITRLARRYGYEAAYIYGKDEAKAENLQAQRSLWSAVHDSGGRVFAAGYDDAYSLVGDVLDMLVWYGKPDWHEAGKWHARGHKILNYANPQSGPENPYLFRLNYGLILWANDYDGAMPYAYQHCFGSCWNDIDDPTYRDHNFTYPTAGDPIPTLAWEGFREAVDDVRYVEALELLADLRGRDSLRQAEEARTFLKDLKEKMRSGQQRAGKYNHDMRVDLDSVRLSTVMHILSLTQS